MNEFNLIRHIQDKDEENIVVWLFNIGTEKYWGDIVYSVTDKNENIIVNHIEEMNLLISRKQDYVILRRQPCNCFLESLMEFGCEIPNILCPSSENEEKSISELVLEDVDLMKKLKKISNSNTLYFVPYGVSYLEEEIANRCGMKLIGASHSISKMINNKIYCRNVAEELSYNLSEGYICKTRDEVQKAYEKLTEKYNKIIIKQPTGASGRGLWIIDNDEKKSIVFNIISRVLKKNSESSFIVEGWVEKKSDLNYQIYVTEGGNVDVFSIKEQLVDETVYVGSFMPPRISNEIKNQYLRFGKEIGKYLYDKGFNGVLGIDSVIAEDNRIIPIIEINARFTLSTYISFIIKKYPKKKIFSFYKKLKSDNEMNYKLLKNVFKEKELWFNDYEGVFCYVSETMNSKNSNGNLRFFGLIIGDNEEYIDRVYNEIQKSIKKEENLK